MTPGFQGVPGLTGAQLCSLTPVPVGGPRQEAGAEVAQALALGSGLPQRGIVRGRQA